MWCSHTWILFVTVALRDRMQRYIGRIPFIWCVFMKHIIPNILLVVFVNLAQTTTETGETLMGAYGGFPMRPYQALGITCFTFALVLCVLGLAFPDLYAPLALPQTKEAMLEIAKYDIRVSQIISASKMGFDLDDVDDDDDDLEDTAADAKKDDSVTHEPQPQEPNGSEEQEA
jgi:hypothetical protein